MARENSAIAYENSRLLRISAVDFKQGMAEDNALHDYTFRLIGQRLEHAERRLADFALNAIPARLDHLLRSKADGVNRGHAPGAVMKTTAGRPAERDQVMVAAMSAMQKCNRSGAVGEAQAKNLRVESDRAADVRCEEEDVRQPAGPYSGGLAAKRSSTKRTQRRRLGDGRPPGWRGLISGADLDQEAARITEP